MPELTIASILRRAVRTHGLGQRSADIFEANRRAAFVYGAAPTCNLALLARTNGYRLKDVEDAVASRTLVRVPAMRGSIYLMPATLVPHALAVTPRPDSKAPLAYARLDAADYDRLAARIEAIVAEKPRTSAEIRAAIGADAPDGDAFTIIVGLMNRTGRLVRAGVRGGAKSQSFEYARMADWVDLPDRLPTRAEALTVLARYWLHANGPASATDFAWWTASKPREADDILKAISTRVIEVEGIAGELHATDEIMDELAEAPDETDEAYLLPCWDSYIMAHRDRSRYLRDADRPYVLDRVGNSTHVILYGGRVVGIWDLDGTTLLYSLFEPLPADLIETAAARLAPIDRITALREIAEPPLLNVPKGGLNAFLGPLRAFRQPTPPKRK